MIIVVIRNVGLIIRYGLSTDALVKQYAVHFDVYDAEYKHNG